MFFIAIITISLYAKSTSPNALTTEIEDFLNDTQNSSQVSKCLTKIGESYFGNNTILKYNESYQIFSEIANDFLRTSQIPIRLESKLFLEVNSHDPNYIFLFETYEYLEDRINELRGRPKWNATAIHVFFYLIIPEPNDLETHDSLIIELVRIIWEYLIGNFIIISQYGSELLIQTANLYLNISECGKKVTLETLGSCNDLTAINDLFNRKHEAKFRHCHFNVFSSRCPPIAYSDNVTEYGLQIDAMNLVAQFLKLNISYMPSAKPSRHNDYDDTMKRLSGIEALVDLGCEAMTNLKFVYNTHILTHTATDQYVLIVPTLPPEPFWLNMIYIFQWSLWILLGGTLCFLSWFLWCGQRRYAIMTVWIMLYRVNLGKK